MQPFPRKEPTWASLSHQLLKNIHCSSDVAPSTFTDAALSLKYWPIHKNANINTYSSEEGNDRFIRTEITIFSVLDCLLDIACAAFLLVSRQLVSAGL